MNRISQEQEVVHDHGREKVSILQKTVLSVEGIDANSFIGVTLLTELRENHFIRGIGEEEVSYGYQRLGNLGRWLDTASFSECITLLFIEFGLYFEPAASHGTISSCVHAHSLCLDAHKTVQHRIRVL